MEPPTVAQKPHTYLLGKQKDDDPEDYMDPPVEVSDEYYWLRDDKRENPEMLEYLRAENKYTEKFMESTKPIQDRIYADIKSKVKETDKTVEVPHAKMDSKYKYFNRTVEGKGYAIHCRVNTETGVEEEILNINTLAEGHEMCDVSSVHVTEDNKYLMYGIDTKGNEKYDIIFTNLETKQSIPNSLGQILFADFEVEPKNYNIWYTQTDDSDRPHELWHYNFVTQEKKLIIREDDVNYSVGYGISDDERYMFVSLGCFENKELYYIDLADDSHTLHKILDRSSNVLSGVESSYDKFIFISNKDNKDCYKAYSAPIDKPGIENWTLIECNAKVQKTALTNGGKLLTHDPSANFKWVTCNKSHLVFGVQVEDISYIYVAPYVNGVYSPDWHEIRESIEDQGSFESYSYFGLGIYDCDELWYTVHSPVSDVIYKKCSLNVNDPNIFGETTLLKIKETPNYDSSLYTAERRYVDSYFGAKVPITMIYRKDTIFPAPTYQYGYGSYGHTVSPNFNKSIVHLLDKGIVYVYAHVRGSRMRGEKWYQDGKMDKKMNTFLDFISVAEYLRKEVTGKEQLAIEGRSAGGLLMGAMITMRPDLFDIVIAGVPFVDVLTTMRDDSIPLTAGEWTQWGNPNKKEYYLYMKQYSPYDNIKEGVKYPNMLILSGLNDPRVQYWEPTKFVARLRANGDMSESVCLLKTEMDKGHFGNTDRYSYIREKAHDYAFVVRMMGLE